MKTLENPSQFGRIFLVLAIGFFIGIFNASLDVGASTLFLNRFEEQSYLPKAIVASGLLGIIFTYFFAYFQNRLPFQNVAGSFILIILLSITAIRLGFDSIPNTDVLIFSAFVCIGPFNAVVFLIFWGVFGRVFNLRESKKIISRIDSGQLLASVIALFAIPFILSFLNQPIDLFWLSSLSAAMIFIILQIVNARYNINKGKQHRFQKKYSFSNLIRNPYMVWMAIFVNISMVCVFLVNYSFLAVTAQQFSDPGNLANFISIFSGTIVIFNFLIQNFVTDRIITMYGLKISLLINPVLLCLFSLFSALIGSYLGYSKQSETFIIFFLAIALSKLFIVSLKDALDNPTFKLYFLPIDSKMRFSIQTRIEGVVTMFAGLIAGSVLWLLEFLAVDKLVYYTYLLVPFIFCWLAVITKLYSYYRQTLEHTLESLKDNRANSPRQAYLVNDMLKNELNSKEPDHIITSLKLIERIEPNLLEQVLNEFNKDIPAEVQAYVTQKIKSLSVDITIQTAYSASSVQEGKPAGNEGNKTGALVIGNTKMKFSSFGISSILRLSRSKEGVERIIASQLLEPVINPDNVFILLELMRDPDISVRKAALTTARKSKMPQTWPMLIDFLSSPTHNYAAAMALIECGTEVLPVLEQVFHKTSRNIILLQKIIHIYGQIGGEKAVDLLWNKIEYPDATVENEVLIALGNCQFQAMAEKTTIVHRLLETEIRKAAWNQAALLELEEVIYNNHLVKALEEEMSHNFDRIFMLLSLIYNPESIRLVKKNIESGTSEGKVYALELLDVFIDKNLKTILFPLLDDIPASEEVSIYQAHFPRQTLSSTEVLLHIINRDYNSINRWTKACAMYSIASTPEMAVTHDLIAHIFNPDILLRQTAAWVICKMEPATYIKLRIRLPEQIRNELDKVVLPQAGESSAYTYEDTMLYQIAFLKQINAFNNLPGLLLSELTGFISRVSYHSGECVMQEGQTGSLPIYLVLSGVVEWYDESGILRQARQGDLLGEMLILDTDENLYTIIAKEDTEIYKIDKDRFYRVMATQPKLLQYFLEYITYKIKLGQAEKIYA